MRTAALLSIAVSAALAGCASDPLPLPPGADAGADLATAPPDLVFAPAPHPPAPQIPDNGGPKLTHPALVTVTWKDDALSARLLDFADWLVTSQYLLGSLSEYGIGAGTSVGAELHSLAGPATLDDKDLRVILESAIKSGALPPVTPDRLYLLYPPDGVTVTYDYGGAVKYQSCTQFQAYHEVGPPTAGGDIIYAVIPRCHLPGTSDLDYTTWGASAQIAEAVTDPTGKGWQARSLDLAFANGGEVTGPCAGQQRIVDGHVVNAIYSNRAAANDQRACVPAPAGPAFGFTAVPTDTLQIAAGKSGSTSLRIWSSSPLPRPLRVDLYVYPMAQGSAKAGSLLAENGDLIPLDISVAPGVAPGSRLYVQVSLTAADYWINGYLAVLVP